MVSLLEILMKVIIRSSVVEVVVDQQLDLKHFQNCYVLLEHK